MKLEAKRKLIRWVRKECNVELSEE